MKYLMITLIFLISISPFQVQAKGIKFLTSFKEGSRMAKEEGKLIFLDFTAKWCMPCKKLSKEVFSNDEVGAYFNTNLINVKVDIDYNKLLSKKYKISSIPKMYLVTHEGIIVNEIKTRDPKKLIAFVDYTIAQYATLSTYFDQISTSQNQDSIEALLNLVQSESSDKAFLEFINKIYGESQLVNDVIAAKYILYTDAEVFDEIIEGVVKDAWLSQDKIRDGIALKLFKKDQSLKLQHVNKIIAEIDKLGFKDITKSKYYLSLFYVQFLGHLNGEKNLSQMQLLFSKKFLIEYANCWDENIVINAINTVLQNDTPTSFYEELAIVLMNRLSENKSVRLLDLYAICMF